MHSHYAIVAAGVGIALLSRPASGQLLELKRDGLAGLTLVAVVDQAASGSAAVGGRPSSPTRPPGASKDWAIVHIPDPVARRFVIQALETASNRLQRDDCGRILADVQGQDGRPLTEVLVALSVDLPAYPTTVVFMDDSRHRRCVTGILAFTTPGSRVVRVCIDELKRTVFQSPDYTVAAMIHEILHTLGLGENPPSPREITERVMKRCLTSRN